MAQSARRTKALGETPPYYTIASSTLLAATPADPQYTPPKRKAQQEWATLYDHCEQRFQSLYTWRVPFWTTWGQIARYMKPYRYYPFITPNLYNQGLRQDYAIVDRTASLCGDVCAAGLMSMLTDPDKNWLTLGPAVPGIELDRAAKAYYADLTERLNYVYDHSNFYDAQGQICDDLTYFGTGPSIDYEDADEILHVFTPCAGEYLLGVDFNNDDEVFAREFRQTVNQTVEMFGVENCPPDILDMWRRKGGALQYENVIGHLIEPNFPIASPNGPDVGVVPGGFTWREVYWLRGKKDSQPLSVTGFHEQPHAAARWNTRGNEAYGRGVGENMLGDTIQLQLETRQKAESLEKVNRPPMGADVSLMNLPMSTNPGKITYMNTLNGGEKKFFPLYEIKPDIPALSADIQLVQQRIARTAYNDVFQLLMSLRQNLKLKADMTTVEIDQLTQEALTQLGPVIGRVYGTLRKRVRRHIAIMRRKGLMPQTPPSLRGIPLKIDFVSTLTEARRAVMTQSVARTTQYAGAISAVWPEAKFLVDADKAVRDFADGVGAPATILRTPQEVKAMIAQQQQNEKMAAMLAQTEQGAAAAQSLSKTSLAPGSALSALVAPPQ